MNRINGDNLVENVADVQETADAFATSAAKRAWLEAVKASMPVEAAEPEASAPAAPKQAECVICLGSMEVAAVLLPCGHICVCAKCMIRWVAEPCPVCREPVEQVVRVFRT